MQKLIRGVLLMVVAAFLIVVVGRALGANSSIDGVSEGAVSPSASSSTGEGSASESGATVRLVISGRTDIPEAAGTESSILTALEEAEQFCHDSTTFQGTAISEVGYAPDEFQGVYVEPKGTWLYLVFQGTIEMPTENGGTAQTGYGCIYVMREKGDNPTSYDNFERHQEGEALPIERGGDKFAKVRDGLRDAHNVKQGDAPGIYITDLRVQLAYEGLSDYVEFNVLEEQNA